MATTKGIAQPSGGMILHMPQLFTLSAMDLMCAIGSLNHSRVGRNVEQSARPKGRSLGFKGALRGFRVLTEDKSSTSETGMVGVPPKEDAHARIVIVERAVGALLLGHGGGESVGLILARRPLGLDAGAEEMSVQC